MDLVPQIGALAGLPDLVNQVGAVAGLAAFFGLAVLSFLYFSQARDVRRLRENASFLVEGPEEPTTQGRSSAATAPRGTAEGEGTAARAGDAEAFRRAVLSRQAAERRQRFETRRRGTRGGRDGGGGRLSSLPEPPALIVIVIGALLLIAGIAFGATRIIGGNGGQTAATKPNAPSQTSVAVLNSTAANGLAGKYTKQLDRKGYQAKPGNFDRPLGTSVVMFGGHNEAAAKQVAAVVRIKQVQAATNDASTQAGGAEVIVILGQDKVSGG